MLHALVTNDDGIDSQGIRVLAAAALAAGFEPTVVAPSWDSSGASAALTAVMDRGRLVVERHHFDGPTGALRAFAVDAAPAFIVTAAMSGAFGPAPEVVLSGVNRGPNTGRAVLHSGTVGAALTAASHGRPAVAVSMPSADPVHWTTAERVAGAVLERVHEDLEPVAVNVNVPDVPADRLRGITAARLSAFGAVDVEVTERDEGFVTLRHEPVAGDPEPDTDVSRLAAGFATVTVLRPACECPTADVPGVDGALRDLLAAPAG